MKPREVEAIRSEEALRVASSSWKGMPRWLKDAYEVGLVVFADRYVAVRAPGEGMTVAREGDWIVRDASGALAAVKGAAFEELYESVEE
jgi:hypothetical protein